MSLRLFSQRVLIVGGVVLGVAIMGLLAFNTYAILSEDDGGPGAQVAQPTQGATPTPTATPVAMPTPTPLPPMPTVTPEPTIEEQPPPPVEEEPAAAEEPPPVQEEAPPPQEPPPIQQAPLATEQPPAPTQPPWATSAQDCQRWVDAGGPADDPTGFASCLTFASELCTAWQTDPTLPSGAEACALLTTLSGSTAPSTGSLLDCRSLEGAIIVAQDGQYLGKITSNQFDSDSIINRFGDYGSRFSSTSIRNEFSDYGGKFGSNSPYNRFADPPLIIQDRVTVAYLTVSSLWTPRVDPDGLIACLES